MKAFKDGVTGYAIGIDKHRLETGEATSRTEQIDPERRNKMRESLDELAKEDATSWLDDLSSSEFEEYERRFQWVAKDARPEQLTPSGKWKTWLLLAGRGSERPGRLLKT